MKPPLQRGFFYGVDSQEARRIGLHPIRCRFETDLLHIRTQTFSPSKHCGLMYVAFNHGNGVRLPAGEQYIGA